MSTQASPTANTFPRRIFAGEQVYTHGDYPRGDDSFRESHPRRSEKRRRGDSHQKDFGCRPALSGFVNGRAESGKPVLLHHPNRLQKDRLASGFARGSLAPLKSAMMEVFGITVSEAQHIVSLRLGVEIQGERRQSFTEASEAISGQKKCDSAMKSGHDCCGFRQLKESDCNLASSHHFLQLHLGLVPMHLMFPMRRYFLFPNIEGFFADAVLGDRWKQ